MQKIKVNLKKISNKTPQPPLSGGLDLIVDFLKRGKVIIYPTDTIYGLGCIATNKKAISKIYKIKKREKKKPLLILVSSLGMLKKYCYVNKKQEEYLRGVWNLTPQPPFRRGAISVILKSRGVLPKELIGDSDSIAVRLPKNEFLVKIIKCVGAPIVSTSLNISGEKSLESVENIEDVLVFNTPPKPHPSPLLTKEGGLEEGILTPQPPLSGGLSEIPDLVVDGGRLKNKPSRIVDFRDVEKIKVIRK